MTRGLFLFLLALPVFPDTLEESRKVIRRATELLEKGDDNWGKFYFVRRREVKEFTSAGQLKTKTSVTTRREPYEDLTISRLIARNDQPIPEEERKKQDETIKTRIAEYRQRLAKEGPPKPTPNTPNRKRSDDDELIREFPEALDYKLIGSEVKNGYQTDRYEFSPRPGYSPKSMKFRMFEKVRGVCWIEKASGELVRVEAEVYDHINVAFGLLGKIGKGTEFRLQRMQAAPGLWVAQEQTMKFDARIMLVKSFRQEIGMQWSEFQRIPEKAKPASGKQSAATTTYSR